MDAKKRRRKRKPSRISFTTMLVLFLLLLIIPLVCLWLGNRHVNETVPDYATGYVVEIDQE